MTDSFLLTQKNLNNKSKDESTITKLHLFEEQQLRTVWDSEQEK